MTEANVSVKYGTVFDRVNSINEEFDVSTLPEFDSPSLCSVRDARSNSQQETRAPFTTAAILLISPTTSTSTVSAEYKEDSDVMALQSIHSRKTCRISSRSPSSQNTTTGRCINENYDIDYKESDFGDSNDSSDSDTDEDSLYAITPAIKSKGGHQRVLSVASISVCESTTSPTMSPLSMECTVNDRRSTQKMEHHSENESEDNILSPSTSITSSCSMRSLKLSLDDGDSQRDSIKQQLVNRRSLKEQSIRAQSKTIHFERNCSVVRNGNLWGRKLNAIPTKHGRQQIVEWKFATMDGIEYKGHVLVLQHEQIRKKRKSKRMIMLDGTVMFCDKTKRTEWKQLRIPYCNHTLHVVIEEKDVNELKYNYRLKIDKVAYCVAFHRWK